MQRLLAVAVACTLATSSFAAVEPCPMAPARARRCCCAPLSHEHPRLTCCRSAGGREATSVARDRPERAAMAVAPEAAARAFVSPGPAVSVTEPRGSVLASAAGPPPLPLRI